MHALIIHNENIEINYGKLFLKEEMFYNISACLVVARGHLFSQTYEDVKKC